MYQYWYNGLQVTDISFVLKVAFYRSEVGNEPVREWLKDLQRDDKRQISEDIKTASLAGPWECRSSKRSTRTYGKYERDWQTALHGFSLRLTAST